MVAQLLLSVLLIGVASAARIPDKEISVYFSCNGNAFAWNGMMLQEFCAEHQVSIFNLGAEGDVSVRIYGVPMTDATAEEGELIASYSPLLSGTIPGDDISEFGTTDGNAHFAWDQTLTMDGTSCSSYCLIAFAEFDDVPSTFVGKRCNPIDCNNVHDSHETRDVVVEINQVEYGSIQMYEEDGEYKAHIGSVVDSVTVRLDWGAEVRPISEDWPLTVAVFLTWAWETDECDGAGRLYYDTHDTTATFFTRDTPLAEGDSWTIDMSDLVMKFGPGRCAKCGDVRLVFQFDPFNLLAETDSNHCNSGISASFNLECHDTDIYTDDNSWTLTVDSDGLQPADRAFLYMCSTNNYNGGVSVYPMGGKVFLPDWWSDGLHYTRLAADFVRHMIDDDAAMCATNLGTDMALYADMSWEEQSFPSEMLRSATGVEWIDYMDDGSRVSIHEEFDAMVEACADKVQQDESVRYTSHEFRQAGCAAIIEKMLHNMECPDKVMYYTGEVDSMRAFMDLLHVNPQYSAMVDYFENESWEAGLDGNDFDNCARSALTYRVLEDTNFLSRVYGDDSEHDMDSGKLYDRASEFFHFFLNDDDGEVSSYLEYLRLCDKPRPWQKETPVPVYYKGEGEFALVGFPREDAIQWTRIARMFCHGC